MVLKGTSFRFRYPGLVLLWSFCLYATGFTPSLYSLGHAGLSRTLNAVKLTYQLLLVVNEVYLVGWLRRRSEKKGEVQVRSDYSSGRFGWWFYVLMGVMMLLVFTRTSNQAGSYSSYGAWYYVHSGEANNLHGEYERRIETIESSGPDVTVEPYRYRPWFLCSGDLSENADSEENRYMAEWYGKNSISCVEKDSE
jgi:hypothetical protein